ncbi:MAG: DUF2927 domain-containing protein [Proteobacteria bacterium]|nr:DUF2927 domain-containing protein [Pseudomonadota bacterium]
MAASAILLVAVAAANLGGATATTDTVIELKNPQSERPEGIGVELRGIVIIPGRSLAMLERRNSKTVIRAREGQKVGDWTIERILADRVVLRRGETRRELKLSHTARPNLGPDGGVLTDERLIRDFDLVAFHNEHSSGIARYLRKWVIPIRIYLDSRAGDAREQRRLTKRHLRHLAKLTGHDISMVEEPAGANVIAVFENEGGLSRVLQEYFPAAPEMEALMNKSVCLGRYTANGRSEIVRAVVIIPPDKAAARGKLLHCIIEELTQTLGLPNDSDEVAPSIFNDRSQYRDLTGHDMILVRLLYDRRLYPGMERQEALRVARKILPQIRGSVISAGPAP